jgi:hypothetical protein
MSPDLQIKLDKLVADESGTSEGNRSDKAMTVIDDIRKWAANEITNEHEVRRQKKAGKK